jgi:very-short-patch-repair endonuclease
MTAAEWKLWQGLRRRFVEGHRFRRQVPLGPYIVDFCCHQLGLIVEADGSQHADSARDEVRDAWLRARGYVVLRIWNIDIVTNFEGVMQSITEAVVEREAELQLPEPIPTYRPLDGGGRA